MVIRRRLSWVGFTILVACGERSITSPPPAPSVDVELRATLPRWGVVPIGPMPEQPTALVTLGRALFFEKALSGNRDVACATCHDPARGLGDGLPLAVGTGGVTSGAGRTPGPGRQFVSRHSPSLLNVGVGLPYVFWDGRISRFGSGPPGTQGGDQLLSPAASLVEQAMLPVLNRREMRGERGDTDAYGRPNELAEFEDRQHSGVWNAIMRRLLAVPEYVQLFGAAFPGTPPEQLTFQHAARAIVAFELAAFTKTRSPFDRYLDRDDNALTLEEKRGALLFFGRAGCSGCHSGPLLGAEQFANVGVPQFGPGGVKEPPLDLGRGELDFGGGYRFAFRVAPLRNVELTAPYMHNGAFATLEEVVRHYNNVERSLREYDPSRLPPALRDRYHGDSITINAILAVLDGRLRRPLDLTADEQRQLVAFLRALTDPAARELTLAAVGSSR